MNVLDGNADEKQKLMSLLRERFLKAAANLNGKQCCFYMQNGTKINGVFRGADIEFNRVLAEGQVKNSSTSIMFDRTDISFLDFEAIDCESTFI